MLYATTITSMRRVTERTLEKRLINSCRFRSLQFKVELQLERPSCQLQSKRKAKKKKIGRAPSEN